MTGTNIKLINLDELSEKISTNLDSRKDAVNEALVLLMPMLKQSIQKSKVYRT